MFKGMKLSSSNKGLFDRTQKPPKHSSTSFAALHDPSGLSDDGSSDLFASISQLKRPSLSGQAELKQLYKLDE